MAMKHHQWIVRLGMGVESLRQQDVGAQENIAPPETRQQFAADADVLDELSIGLRLDGLDLLVERQRGSHRVRRIDVQLDGR